MWFRRLYEREPGLLKLYFNPKHFSEANSMISLFRVTRKKRDGKPSQPA